MLLGRERERQALDRVLADARDGRSSVLALVGDPGIGKSALLDEVAGRAEGMRVLRARGIESEAEVPFGGLLELLRPALGVVDQIPRPQAHALGGALALRPAHAGDRFAIGASTLSLLAAFAEREPLLLLIDDAQSLDAASAAALLFAFRRLLADPIAVLIAARSASRRSSTAPTCRSWRSRALTATRRPSWPRAPRPNCWPQRQLSACTWRLVAIRSRCSSWPRRAQVSARHHYSCRRASPRRFSNARAPCPRRRGGFSCSRPPPTTGISRRLAVRPPGSASRWKRWAPRRTPGSCH